MATPQPNYPIQQDGQPLHTQPQAPLSQGHPSTVGQPPVAAGPTTGTAQPPHLQSTPPANSLAIFPQYIAHQPTQILLREKVLSLSGDSFSINLLSGEPVFQVKGEAMSMSGRKHFMSVNGEPLFDIRKELLKLHATFYCERPGGERIFQVKSKFSIGSSKAYGTFKNHDGRDVELLMKGDFFDSKADITDSASGRVVATIDRQFLKARELLAGQQTYLVNIQPGVDMAMIAAMCICLDEKRNEGHS